MADPIFQLSGMSLAGVAKRDGGRARLDAITLDIRPGVTAVLGPSGAGKSSLLNLLVGYERPTAGSLTFNPPTNGRLPIFWSPPDQGLWPDRTAYQHIAHVLPSGRPIDPARMLAQFDLADLAKRYPAELSLGERSRLAVARALASDAAVLVLDEPLAHVDDHRADRYWQVLAEAVRDGATSVVFASHDPQRVTAFAEHAVCLEAGRITYHGSVETLYDNPPTESLASMLGPFNWFESNDDADWLTDAKTGLQSYRPEQLAVEPDPAGNLRLESTRQIGPIAQSVFKRDDGDVSRRLVHRVLDKPVQPGDRVILRVCLLIMLMLISVVGCARTDAPQLPVREIRTWHVPVADNSLPAPRAITNGPNQQVLVLDTDGRVLVYHGDGTFDRSWRMPSNEVGNPEGILVLKDGRIAVADTHYNRVVFFTPDGEVESILGSHGEGPGEFIYPVKIVQDDDGDLYVAEYGSNDRVQKFTVDGEFICEFGSLGTGDNQFQRPSGMVWRDGVLFVADAMNNRILVFKDDGTFMHVLGSGLERPPKLHFPYDLTLGPDDHLYVAEYGSSRITCLDLDGRLVGSFGRGGTQVGQFITPWGLAIDDDMRLRVADTGNRRIVEMKL